MDRELLELAALAAGIGGGWDIPRGRGTPVCYRRDGGKMWSPLTDDGDALRLAVKLGICFGPNFDGDLAVCFGSDGHNITEPFGADPCAATRRAIVRAAAAISQKG